MNHWIITGGTGSLGHALTAKFLSEGSRVTVVSRGELAQAQMAARFDRHPNLRMFLGDVRDQERMEEIFSSHDPQNTCVVHAAALKRVDDTACNPDEMVETNVQGTRRVLRAARYAGVRRVVFVSSDKAVQPTNAYGASKQMGEHITVQSNTLLAPRGTHATVVRYGNVFGSRGSVYWTWKTQYPNLKLTDVRMTRFWLSLPRAVELVRLATQVPAGCIVVPKLHSSGMHRLALYLFPDAQIEETGLRPGGEKLHEALLSEEEGTRTDQGTGYYLVWPAVPTWRPPVSINPIGRMEYTSQNAPVLDLAEVDTWIRDLTDLS